MPFWAYMLHCRGGAFYVGHTDDLDHRIGEHRSGLIPGFTSERLPIELVWSQECQVRDDAKAAEQRIKGWSRAKKLALIRGDWVRISELAKNKYGPSTSAGKTGVGEVGSFSPAHPELEETAVPPTPAHPELVEGPYFPLTRHPDHPSLDVSAIAVRLLKPDRHWLTLRWRISGAQTLVIPPFAGRRRADGLWRSTCFELFVVAAQGAYAEFNLSPAESWAAYDFVSYREAMAERPMPRAPVCSLRGSGDVVLFEAAIPRAALPPLPAAIGISAVIAEEGGAKSYWALAHAHGPPDFHDPACFALTLAPPAPA